MWEQIQNVHITMYLIIVAWIFGLAVVCIFLWALLGKQFKNTQEMNHKILDYEAREYEGDESISPLNEKKENNTV